MRGDMKMQVLLRNTRIRPDCDNYGTRSNH